MAVPPSQPTPARSASPRRSPPRRAPLALAAPVAAAWAAVVSYVPLALLSIVGSLGSGGTAVGGARFALAAWLLGHGVPITTPTDRITLAPLAVTALAAWRVARAGVHASRAAGGASSRTVRPALSGAAAVALAYAVIGAGAAALARTPAVTVSPLRAATAYGFFGLAAATLGALATSRAARAFLRGMPDMVRAGVRLGLVVAALLVAAGAAMTGAALAARGGEASDMLGSYRAGLVGQAGNHGAVPCVRSEPRRVGGGLPAWPGICRGDRDDGRPWCGGARPVAGGAGAGRSAGRTGDRTVGRTARRATRDRYGRRGPARPPVARPSRCAAELAGTCGRGRPGRSGGRRAHPGGCHSRPPVPSVPEGWPCWGRPAGAPVSSPRWWSASARSWVPPPSAWSAAGANSASGRPRRDARRNADASDCGCAGGGNHEYEDVADAAQGVGDDAHDDRELGPLLGLGRGRCAPAMSPACRRPLTFEALMRAGMARGQNRKIETIDIVMLLSTCCG